MEERVLNIHELQPSDTLRANSQAFFRDLGLKRVKELKPLPQVWDKNGQLIISDGNNRIGFYAQNGEKEALVEYAVMEDNDPSFGLYNEDIVSKADRLSKQGIRTPFDLITA